MAIEYERVNWDTTKYVNPTNMNQMDAGIKAACDGVDENSTQITAINSNLQQLNNVSLKELGEIKGDFNNYVEMGLAYSANYAAVANRPQNNPDSCILIVLRIPSTGWIVQVLYSSYKFDGIYVRRNYSDGSASGWSEWRRVAYS